MLPLTPGGFMRAFFSPGAPSAPRGLLNLSGAWLVAGLALWFSIPAIPAIATAQERAQERDHEEAALARGAFKLAAAVRAEGRGGLYVSGTSAGAVEVATAQGWIALDAGHAGLLLRFDEAGHLAWGVAGAEEGGEVAALPGGGAAWVGHLGGRASQLRRCDSSGAWTPLLELRSGQVEEPRAANSCFVACLNPEGALLGSSVYRDLALSLLRCGAGGIFGVGTGGPSAQVNTDRGAFAAQRLPLESEQGRRPMATRLSVEGRAVWVTGVGSDRFRVEAACVTSASLVLGGVFDGSGALLGTSAQASPLLSPRSPRRPFSDDGSLCDTFLGSYALESGALEWAAQLAGEEAESLHALTALGGELYLLGEAWGAWSYARAGARGAPGSPRATLQGAEGSFVLKLDREGLRPESKAVELPRGMSSARATPQGFRVGGWVLEPLRHGSRTLSSASSCAYLLELRVAPQSWGRAWVLPRAPRELAQAIPLGGEPLRLIGGRAGEVLRLTPEVAGR